MAVVAGLLVSAPLAYNVHYNIVTLTYMLMRTIIVNLACMVHHPQYGSSASRQLEHVLYLSHCCTGNLYTCQSLVIIIKIIIHV